MENIWHLESALDNVEQTRMRTTSNLFTSKAKAQLAIPALSCNGLKPPPSPLVFLSNRSSNHPEATQVKRVCDIKVLTLTLDSQVMYVVNKQALYFDESQSSLVIDF